MIVVLAGTSVVGDLVKELLEASPDAVFIALGCALVILCVIGTYGEIINIEKAWRILGLFLGLLAFGAGLYLHEYHQTPDKPPTPTPVTPAITLPAPSPAVKPKPTPTKKNVVTHPERVVKSTSFVPCNKFSIVHADDVATYNGRFEHKAMAISNSNCWQGFASGLLNIEDAQKGALRACQDRAKQEGDKTECKIVMVDGQKVNDF